eukprot:TRINITY_DN69932_c0_g1_i2.p1 TRINITY_DN69932_c0_g1~~TRINITY_DN69932_c0_g1_i2.p1  ORF type:complete len:521 (+),score=144.37 TRINITY_DN69932_c0_g1_i2:65-1564(+)
MLACRGSSCRAGAVLLLLAVGPAAGEEPKLTLDAAGHGVTVSRGSSQVALGAPAPGLPVVPTPVPSHKNSSTEKSPALGFIGVSLAAAGFGSNFIVIKKYDPGDGMFFQLCMCLGIWMTGLVFHLAKGSPAFQPAAMIGGALWCLGNAMCPFIIDVIGMGLGLSVWGAVNMVAGWSGAHFGWFGLTKQTVSDSGMNIAGALVAVASVIVYAQVKATSGEEAGDADAEEREALRDPQADSDRGRIRSVMSGRSDRSNVSAVSFSGGAPLVGVKKGGGALNADGDSGPVPNKGRMFAGLFAALLAGIFFGTSFNPAQVTSDYAAKHHCNKRSSSSDACEAVLEDGGRIYCKWDDSADEGKKCGGMPIPDMVLSQFCGTMLMSWILFVGYGLFRLYRGRRNNDPTAVPGPQTAYMYVNVPLIIPSFLCGIIWAIAQIGWFIANDNLSMTVAFPVVCATPAIIGNLWGIFVYNEVVRTPLNIATLILGMVLSAVAGTLVSVSK